MDWTAPLAVIGWMLVGCLGIGLVILALATVAAIRGMRRPERLKKYPYSEGNTIVLGPEVFASKDRKVLCWQGENYQLQRLRESRHVAEIRRDIHEALVMLSAPEADRVRGLISDLESQTRGCPHCTPPESCPVLGSTH